MTDPFRKLIHDLRDALTPVHAIIQSRSRRALGEQDFEIIEESLRDTFRLLNEVSAREPRPRWRHPEKAAAVYEEHRRSPSGTLNLRQLGGFDMVTATEDDLLAAGFRRYEPGDTT